VHSEQTTLQVLKTWTSLRELIRWRGRSYGLGPNLRTQWTTCAGLQLSHSSTSTELRSVNSASPCWNSINRLLSTKNVALWMLLTHTSTIMHTRCIIGSTRCQVNCVLRCTHNRSELLAWRELTSQTPEADCKPEYTKLRPKKITLWVNCRVRPSQRLILTDPPSTVTRLYAWVSQRRTSPGQAISVRVSSASKTLLLSAHATHSTPTWSESFQTSQEHLVKP